MLSFAAASWCMLTLWVMPPRVSGLVQFRAVGPSVPGKVSSTQRLCQSKHCLLPLWISPFQDPCPSSLLHTHRQPECLGSLACHFFQGRDFLPFLPPMQCGYWWCSDTQRQPLLPQLRPLPTFSHGAFGGCLSPSSELHCRDLGILYVSLWRLHVRIRALEFFDQHSPANCVHFPSASFVSRGLSSRVPAPQVLM